MIEEGALGRSAGLIAGFAPSSVLVLTHPALAGPYAESLLVGLRAAGVRVSPLALPPGERGKSLRTVERVYAAMAEASLDRRSLLVTVGGGVLGDLGGFAAATYLRGIDFVQAPTTLLAQVDASVGGKTGVDLPQGKNLVGAFHQPRAVIIDTATLRTLPARELRAGLAEVVKYGIIRDAAFFERVGALLPALLGRRADALTEVIRRSCEIKAEVVSADETEQGLRAVLNFGHTVGHALEAVTSYRRYKHGEAISIGMISACLVGERLGVTPPEVTARVEALLRAARLPVDYPADLATDAVIAAMERDKKRVAGRHTFVLARRIGEVEIRGDVPETAIREAIAEHLRRGSAP
jgi:3-dehydroquinate synthase